MSLLTAAGCFVGQASTALMALFGLAWIPLMDLISGQLYVYLQSVQAYISPPIAAVFLIGVLWPRANARGALAALLTGLVLGFTRLALELNRGSLARRAHRRQRGACGPGRGGLALLLLADSVFRPCRERSGMRLACSEGSDRGTVGMQTREFLGQVQHKARLATLGEAMRATRATLGTLAERLGPDEARHLAAQLPYEIQIFFRDTATPIPERFSPDEFLQRVCAREGLALPESAQHARVVMDVLTEAVSPGETTDVLARLPDDYRRVFAGGEDIMAEK